MIFFFPAWLTQAWLANQFAQIQTQFSKGQTQIMAGITDIETAQAAEKADLATLVGLITQILAAVASGQMTAVQAQAVLNEINNEDATVQTQIAAITAALPPASAPVVPAPAPTS